MRSPALHLPLQLQALGRALGMPLAMASLLGSGASHARPGHQRQQRLLPDLSSLRDDGLAGDRFAVSDD